MVQNQIFSIYHDVQRADDVVDQLLAAGIGRKHVSILTSETGGARHLGLTQGTKAAEGKRILNERGLDVTAANDLDDAAQKVVKAVGAR